MGFKIPKWSTGHAPAKDKCVNCGGKHASFEPCPNMSSQENMNPFISGEYSDVLTYLNHMSVAFSKHEYPLDTFFTSITTNPVCAAPNKIINTLAITEDEYLHLKAPVRMIFIIDPESEGFLGLTEGISTQKGIYHWSPFNVKVWTNISDPVVKDEIEYTHMLNGGFIVNPFDVPNLLKINWSDWIKNRHQNENSYSAINARFTLL